MDEVNNVREIRGGPVGEGKEYMGSEFAEIGKFDVHTMGL